MPLIFTASGLAVANITTESSEFLNFDVDDGEFHKFTHVNLKNCKDYSS